MIRIFIILFIVGHVQAQPSDFDAVDFYRADSVATHYRGENLSNLPVLSFNLTSPFSNKLEQFRAIYTWVSCNIDNDYGLYLKNRKKRKKEVDDTVALASWNDKFRSHVFKKLIKEQKTVCTGYAYLVSELAGFADINCKIINGYGRTVDANVGGPGILNHSWNAVQLEDNWYLCDATWSSGSIIPSEAKFIKSYNDGYFLADPRLFLKNHYPKDTIWMLTTVKPTLDTFLNGPLVYKNSFNHNILPVFPETLHVDLSKGETFVITLKKFGKNTDMDGLVLELSKERSVKPEVELIGADLYQVRHTFEHRGKYDVHLKFGSDYILTYNVKVK